MGQAVADINSGIVTALYLFDVAQAVNVDAVQRLLGAEASVAKLDDKSAGPTRLQYTQPPVVADGRVCGWPDIEGFRVRVKCYDYGVISLMLYRPFAGSWSELVSLGQSLIENEPLEDRATAVCRDIVRVLAPAMTGVHASYLSEDYLVFAVTDAAGVSTAMDLLPAHGRDIAQLLRGERVALSDQERDAVLANALSYLNNDLVVAAWNAAFVYDTEPNVLATIEIFELANSQLLEYRYHDELLESELTHIYAELQQERWID